MEQRQHGNPIKSAGEVNLQEEGYARFNPPSRGDGAGVSVTGEVASEKRETQSFSEASGAHQQWCVHMSALSQRRSQIYGISEVARTLLTKMRGSMRVSANTMAAREDRQNKLPRRHTSTKPAQAWASRERIAKWRWLNGGPHGRRIYVGLLRLCRCNHQ